MITIKNKLDQPLSVASGSLPAGGSITVRSLDDELIRLEAKGLISVLDPKSIEPPKSDPPKLDTKPEGKKEGANK